MELLNQHAKNIMEECKSRARDAGLKFDNDSLEYIVTNRDMLELSPKHMIPTLYDYWMHDVDLLQEKGKYELYPSNPYETVINSRPAISYYNDNNPDWLNVMIFYHVLSHIDFFQNNLFFKHTWDDDFVGRALSDKRLLNRLRSEHGRWVDYVLEFARGVDNLVGYFDQLRDSHSAPKTTSRRLDYYFDVFLQKEKKLQQHQYLKELEKYNEAMKNSDDFGENVFFSEVINRYPEFESMFEKYIDREKWEKADVMEFVIEHSPFMRRNDNRWMKSVLKIVRGTSMYFQPQIRTKIINEGWASYWHDRLFINDDRVSGNEVNYARINAKVTGIPRVGINPYAVGLRMIAEIHDRANKGKLGYDYFRLTDIDERKHFDAGADKGDDILFKLREEFCDFTLINTFCDQDFCDRYKLFVVGRRLNPQRQVWEYYVKSRRAEDYRDMLIDSLYHPPYITVDTDKTTDELLYLNHHFEGKGLIREYLDQVMLGLEYLWGAPVELETTKLLKSGPQRVLYHMEEQKLSEKKL